MKLLKTLPLILLALVLITFAVTNREVVVITLWPFPFEAQMPLFFVFFAGLFAGLALAGFLLALKGVRHYFELRKTRTEHKGLATKVSSLEQELAQRPPKHGEEDYGEEAAASPRPPKREGRA